MGSSWMHEKSSVCKGDACKLVGGKGTMVRERH